MAVQRLAVRGRIGPGGGHQPPLPLARRLLPDEPLDSYTSVRADAADLQQQLARLLGIIELFSLSAQPTGGEALFAEELLETVRPLLGLTARLRAALEES